MLTTAWIEIRTPGSRGPELRLVDLRSMEQPNSLGLSIDEIGAFFVDPGDVAWIRTAQARWRQAPSSVR